MAIAESVRSFSITHEFLSLIAELDEFKGTWRAVTLLAPERLAALRHVATVESIGSSTRIEGAKLSDREVETLLSRIAAHSFRSRDEEEVAGYAEVMERIFQSYESIPITENYIQQLHSVLLRHSGKDEHHRGRYKTSTNNIEAFSPDGKSLGIIFETAAPFETPLRMRDLVEWTQSAISGRLLHPLLITSMFIAVFLAIHPFQDGNGRLSRVLTMLLLLKAGYAYVPFSSLESVIEQNKEGYYLALRRTQTSLKSNAPDWEPWVHFFLRSLQRQKLRLEEKIDQSRLTHVRLEPTLKHHFEETFNQGGLSALDEKILDLARTQDRISVGKVISATGANRGTIKLHLASLVRCGILVRHGQGRGTWYSIG